ncbi:hypothetical protein [Halocatena pleomorpha]|uniref:Twin-arginine translocation signal domain-containing protein n=1 Tax=Halocatena pleomorpha TaxID=1785090 RepID=A0A3P3RMC4_9EURY|nr:hypothetical protein [Halocatena pleomorpha]RRJ34020.1 hypothetical protein EIK79_00440 [Halocatena pleomorpha]
MTQPLSRRRFVKTVSAGVLGVSGVAVSTDTARAATNVVRVEGQTDGEWHNYELVFAGKVWEDSSSNDVENGDSVDYDDGYVSGSVFGARNFDSYAHTGYLIYVKVDGHIRFHSTDPTANGFMSVTGLTGWSDYDIDSNGLITPDGNLEQGQDGATYGGAYGSVFEGGEDYYSREGDIIGIEINGHAEMSL